MLKRSCKAKSRARQLRRRRWNLRSLRGLESLEARRTLDGAAGEMLVDQVDVTGEEVFLPAFGDYALLTESSGGMCGAGQVSLFSKAEISIDDAVAETDAVTDVKLDAIPAYSEGEIRIGDEFLTIENPSDIDVTPCWLAFTSFVVGGEDGEIPIKAFSLAGDADGVLFADDAPTDDQIVWLASASAGGFCGTMDSTTEFAVALTDSDVVIVDAGEGDAANDVVQLDKVTADEMPTDVEVVDAIEDGSVVELSTDLLVTPCWWSFRTLSGAVGNDAEIQDGEEVVLYDVTAEEHAVDELSEAEVVPTAVELDGDNPDVVFYSMSGAGGGVSINLWHNASEPLDTSGDGYVSPIDILVVINALSNEGTYQLPRGAASFAGDVAFRIDVNNDGFLAPIDALQVINFLNSDELESIGAIDAAISEAMLEDVADVSAPASSRMAIWADPNADTSGDAFYGDDTAAEKDLYWIVNEDDSTDDDVNAKSDPANTDLALDELLAEFRDLTAR